MPRVAPALALAVLLLLLGARAAPQPRASAPEPGRFALDFQEWLRGVFATAMAPAPALLRWSPDALAKAVLQPPAPARQRGLRRRLAAGLPLRVVAIGGSITAGVGVPPALRPTLGWARLLFAYLNRTYPHAAHDLQAVAVNGAGSAFFSTCGLAHVPPGTDVVLTEFAINDRELPGLVAFNYDALVRALLRQGVAVVVSLSWVQRDDLQHYATPNWRRTQTYRNVAVYQLAAQRHGLGCLFVAPALLHKVPRRRTAGYFSGLWHPSPRGHALMATAAAHLWGAVAEAPAPGPPAAAGGPPPEPPPPPAEGKRAVCYFHTDLQRRAQPPAEGWGWVDEGAPGAAKTGFVAHRPGAVLLLGPFDVSNAHAIALGYLVSYSGYGRFAVEGRGCQGSPVVRTVGEVFPFPVVDAHHGERTSVTAVTIFRVKGGARCHLQLTVLNATSSTGHKVKVLSVAVLPRAVKLPLVGLK